MYWVIPDSRRWLTCIPINVFVEKANMVVELQRRHSGPRIFAAYDPAAAAVNDIALRPPAGRQSRRKDESMITFTNTLTIDRPVSEVYPYLSELEHIPEWNWAIETTTKTSPGPVQVGATYRQTRRIPKPAVEMLTITALDEPRRIGVRGTLAGLPARLDYELADESGATRLVNTVELEISGTPRLFAPLLGDRIRKSVAQNLRALKETVEAAHGAG